MDRRGIPPTLASQPELRIESDPLLGWREEVGYQDLVVAEGKFREGTNRGRPAPSRSELASARDRVPDDRSDILIGQAQDPRLNGATPVTTSDRAAATSAKVPPPDQPTSPVGVPMLST